MILVPPPPPPQALRLFFFHRGERETWLTGDEAPLRPFSPSRLSLRANFHREKDAWTQLFETWLARQSISANLILNFSTGFFFFSSEAFSRMTSSILFRAPNYRIVEKRIKLNWLFKLSHLNSKFALTMGNPASNNPALDMRQISVCRLLFKFISVKGRRNRELYLLRSVFFLK